MGAPFSGARRARPIRRHERGRRGASYRGPLAARRLHGSVPQSEKTPIGAWGGSFAPGVDPARGDYASFADFSDPDGNRWVLQERGYRHDADAR
jgi:hypothetical protein